MTIRNAIVSYFYKKEMGIIGLIFIFSTRFFLSAQNNELNKLQKKIYPYDGGIAAAGHNIVSYFTGKPKKGYKSLVYNLKGVSNYFYAQSNLDLLKTAPEKFAPPYGDWCSYALQNSGEKIEADPGNF